MEGRESSRSSGEFSLSLWIRELNLSIHQYIVRVILCPPDSLVDHIPSFRHEEGVQIMTDYWGVPGREVTSVGGTPTPALGLARSHACHF